MKLANSYHKLGSDFYKEQNPDQVKNPELIKFNQELAKELGLEIVDDKKYLADVFSGNHLLEGSKPVALAYAGHQFGHFVPQLGDGRAILLGEIADKNNILQDLQLKGSGRTFFSRNGDGKYPLDAAIREYLVGEAMHFLNISTTRSLAIIKSDEFIQRDGFLPASVVARVAKSHIRVGTFEYFAARGDLANLKILADYAIKRHFAGFKDNQYFHLLKSVIKLQAELVASWMSVGFIHGVMNTDNTAISGQTIDYGPCAFMDEYESDKVFSFIDQNGRYRFSNQKNIILWNLIKFAETILPLINNNIKEAIKLAEKELNKFPDLFDKIYYKKMAKKIGIFDFKNAPEDKNLIDDFLKILEEERVDFTNSFRVLNKIILRKNIFYIKNNQYLNWQQKWLARLEKQGLNLEKIAAKMDKINPILIPRNHIIANIIQKAVFKNDFSEFDEFLQAIQNPFAEDKKYDKYYLPPKQGERVANTFCGT